MKFHTIHTPCYSVLYLIKCNRIPARSNERKLDPHYRVILYEVLERDPKVTAPPLNSIGSAIDSEDPACGVS